MKYFIKCWHNTGKVVGDETQSGSLVEVLGLVLETRMDGRSRDSTRMIVHITAKEVYVSVYTVHNIIQDNLKYRKTRAR